LIPHRDADPREQDPAAQIICWAVTTKRRPCHGSERIAEAKTRAERKKVDSLVEPIQSRIYALVRWILRHTLAGCPQFFHLRACECGGFWRHNGNGCRTIRFFIDVIKAERPLNGSSIINSE
jgi:hypothetical protein